MLNDPTRPKWKAGCLKLFCFTNLSPVKAKTHFLFCLLILLSVRILFSSVVPLFILQILSKVLPRTAFMLQWISHTHTRERGELQELYCRLRWQNGLDTAGYSRDCRACGNYFVCYCGKHQNIKDSWYKRAKKQRMRNNKKASRWVTIFDTAGTLPLATESSVTIKIRDLLKT